MSGVTCLLCGSSGECELQGEDKEKYKYPDCFLPEEDKVYPLCIGQGELECAECQLRADWEPEDLYGVNW